MRGDFTRDTFDARKQFSRVLRQQGRVELDADTNEQTAILLHYIRTLASDLLGPHAGPADHLGFELLTAKTANVEARLQAMEPDKERRAALLEALKKPGEAIFTPGRYYVQGILVENHRPVLYSEQPGYPFNSDTTREQLEKFGRGMLVYLDVWERHVTYIDDDSIREVALGGPDTSSRAQVVWQVKVLLETDAFKDQTFSCGATKFLPSLGTGRLRARARRDKPPTDLCVIPPESRYRGAENQLYRVEIHSAGKVPTESAAKASPNDAGRDKKEGTGKGSVDSSGPTFKWSRDNGSVVFPITSLAGTTVLLSNLGRDRRSTLAPGDWVEVVDDSVVFGEKAGALAQVESVDRDASSVTLKAPAGTTLPSYVEAGARAKHALLRRWDHVGDPARGGAIAVVEQPSDPTKAAVWLDLEDGIQVAFSTGGDYRVGDYWLIPARTATGDVEWLHETHADGTPVVDEDGNPVSKEREAKGPRHYYAPLLLVPGLTSNGQRPSPIDCRCRIKTLPCYGAYGYSSLGAAIGGDQL